MLNLLRADLMRMKREKAFYVGLAVMVIISLSGVFSTLRDNMVTVGYVVDFPDTFLLSGSLFIGLTSALFTAFFIGTEYSDGTMRNKLIAGHTRVSIYLSELLSCTIAAFIQHSTCLVMTSVLGSIFLGGIRTPVKELALMLLVSFLAVLALTAVFVMLALLIPNKAAIAIILVVALILLIGAFVAMSKLAEPEFYESIIYSGTDGIKESGNVPNPSYPRGVWRQIYAFIFDFLPNGQMFQEMNIMSEFSGGLTPPVKPAMIMTFMAYSAFITLTSTATGILLFKRKDLK